jgi:catechol 2,3-dioxygenase-like lactoylglutathione lyase family enzyme
VNVAVTGTDFVTIPIQDFELSKAFYRDTLGLEEGKQWGEMPAQEFETGNLTIAIMDPTAFGQEFSPAGGSSVVLQVDDFDAAKADLEAKGVEFVTDKIDSGICHQAYFKDPDGNVLGIHNRYDV